MPEALALIAFRNFWAIRVVLKWHSLTYHPVVSRCLLNPSQMAAGVKIKISG